MPTLKAGLIGTHLSRSRLAGALDVMCLNAGIDLDFRVIDVAGEKQFDFDAAIQGLRADGWDGISVTHPFKTNAARLAAKLGKGVAGGLGASNLLKFDDPVAAYNTDQSGFRGAWKAAMGDAGPGRVAMAGAGGVARAIAAALVDLGAREISVWDCDHACALALSAEFGQMVNCVPIARAADVVRGADGLINATPLGMAQNPGSAFDAEWIGGQNWAFDAVYTPTNTAFLTMCGQAGLSCLTGFDLFRHMAVDTFEIYTGVALDRAQAVAQLEQFRPD